MFVKQKDRGFGNKEAFIECHYYGKDTPWYFPVDRTKHPPTLPRDAYEEVPRLQIEKDITGLLSQPDDFPEGQVSYPLRYKGHTIVTVHDPGRFRPVLQPAWNILSDTLRDACEHFTRASTSNDKGASLLRALSTELAAMHILQVKERRPGEW